MSERKPKRKNEEKLTKATFKKWNHFNPEIVKSLHQKDVEKSSKVKFSFFCPTKLVGVNTELEQTLYKSKLLLKYLGLYQKNGQTNFRPCGNFLFLPEFISMVWRKKILGLNKSSYTNKSLFNRKEEKR